MKYFQGKPCSIYIGNEEYDLNPLDPRDREIIDM